MRLHSPFIFCYRANQPLSCSLADDVKLEPCQQREILLIVLQTDAAAVHVVQQTSNVERQFWAGCCIKELAVVRAGAGANVNKSLEVAAFCSSFTFLR